MADTRHQIEGMYQRAMNLRDSTWQSINMEAIEEEYRKQYLRAYRRHQLQDLSAFRQQTKEYRALLKAFRQMRLSDGEGDNNG